MQSDQDDAYIPPDDFDDIKELRRELVESYKAVKRRYECNGASNSEACDAAIGHVRQILKQAAMDELGPDLPDVSIHQLIAWVGRWKWIVCFAVVGGLVASWNLVAYVTWTVAGR